jgi:hypothetical protein
LTYRLSSLPLSGVYLASLNSPNPVCQNAVQDKVGPYCCDNPGRGSCFPTKRTVCVESKPCDCDSAISKQEANVCLRVIRSESIWRGKIGEVRKESIVARRLEIYHSTVSVVAVYSRSGLRTIGRVDRHLGGSHDRFENRCE